VDSVSLATAASRRRWAQLGLFYAAAMWGATFFVVKGALVAVDPFALVGWRFLLSAAILLALLLWQRKPLLRHWPAGLLLGLVLGVLYVAQTLGLFYTTASNSGFITGLFIVFVPFMGWIAYRRAPRKRHLLAVVIAVAGLWLLTGGVKGANAGDLITLFSSFTYALHVFLCERYVRRNYDLIVLTFQQVLVTAVIGLGCALALGRPLEVQTTGAAWTIVFLAVFPTLSAFMVQLVAQRIVDALETSLILTTEPVFAALFAWTLGGELLVPIRALGGLVIVVAMLVSELDWGRLFGQRRRAAAGG